MVKIFFLNVNAVLLIRIKHEMFEDGPVIYAILIYARNAFSIVYLIINMEFIDEIQWGLKEDRQVTCNYNEFNKSNVPKL